MFSIERVLYVIWPWSLYNVFSVDNVFSTRMLECVLYTYALWMDHPFTKHTQTNTPLRELISIENTILHHLLEHLRCVSKCTYFPYSAIFSPFPPLPLFSLATLSGNMVTIAKVDNIRENKGAQFILFFPFYFFSLVTICAFFFLVWQLLRK